VSPSSIDRVASVSCRLFKSFDAQPSAVLLFGFENVYARLSRIVSSAACAEASPNEPGRRRARTAFGLVGPRE